MVIHPTVFGDNRSSDIYSENLSKGIIYLVGEVTDEQAASVIAQMHYQEGKNWNSFEGEDEECQAQPIRLYINSPGGSVSAGLAILDTMQTLRCPVHTYCMGRAASMGAVLLAGGEKGHRYILPHAEVMIHQPSGGMEGKSSDMVIAAEHIKETREVLNTILAQATGRPIREIRKDTELDHWMNAEAALEYGIVDQIL